MTAMDWHAYERAARDSGFPVVCGIDEAGRGPLFGPVCAACVILPENCDIPGINDSKKLTAKKRSALYEVIIQQAVAFGIGYASAAEIDEMNILNATYLAMRRAYDEMKAPASCALIDGNRIPDPFPVPAYPIVKGDAVSISIAAASILAKVTRDRLMETYDAAFPAYGFAKHKGYPTKLHYEKIHAHGVLPEHRKTFLKSLERHAQ